MNKNLNFLFCRIAIVFVLLGVTMGCKDNAVNDGDATKDEVETLYQDKVDKMNVDATIISRLVNGTLEVTANWTDDNGNRSIQFSNELVTTVYANENYTKMKTIPLLGVDENANWICDYYEEIFPLKTKDGNVASVKNGSIPTLRLNKTKYWEYTFDGKSWMQISDKQVGKIENAERGAFSFFEAATLSEDLSSMTISIKTGTATYNVPVKEMETTLAWNKFVLGAEDNLLLDFSYAGYKHGEESAPDGKAWGFKEENIRNYMTEGSDYARDALNKILEKYDLNKLSGNSNAKVLIYFPEGDYILHNNSDNTKDPDKTTGDKDELGNNTSHSIDIFGGNVIIKGAGRDKTRLIMETPNLPNSNAMYSSPVMISIRRNAWLPGDGEVGKNSPGTGGKGTFALPMGKYDDQYCRNGCAGGGLPSDNRKKW